MSTQTERPWGMILVDYDIERGQVADLWSAATHGTDYENCQIFPVTTHDITNLGGTQRKITCAVIAFREAKFPIHDALVDHVRRNKNVGTTFRLSGDKVREVLGENVKEAVK